jgi:hypothetical protein
LRNNERWQPHEKPVVDLGISQRQRYGLPLGSIGPEASTLVMLMRDQFVCLILEHPALSVDIRLKRVAMMSRSLSQTSEQLVDYLQD